MTQPVAETQPQYVNTRRPFSANRSGDPNVRMSVARRDWHEEATTFELAAKRRDGDATTAETRMAGSREEAIPVMTLVPVMRSGSSSTPSKGNRFSVTALRGF